MVALVAAARMIPGGASASGGDSRAAGTPARSERPGGYSRAASDGAVVHVTGAVRRPGVYRLDGGGRVRDAVRLAGGASRRANLEAINLAARLNDGQQVVVPRRVQPAAAGQVSGQEGGSGPISLGSATAEQLDGLDGVGPSIARKIIDWRTQHGGFGSVDDLDQVPGIGPKKLEALRSQLAP